MTLNLFPSQHLVIDNQMFVGWEHYDDTMMILAREVEFHLFSNSLLQFEQGIDRVTLLHQE